MKTHLFKFSISVINSINEFDKVEQKLILASQQASKQAYAPYSQFFVGAAILLEDGYIVAGNNQENAAYPSSMCAERVAIFGASANYPNVKIKTIAINAHANNFVLHKPITPCGGCRQVINEYENKQKDKIKIILSSDGNEYWIIDSIKDLLPLSFDAKSLEGK